MLGCVSDMTIQVKWCVDNKAESNKGEVTARGVENQPDIVSGLIKVFKEKVGKHNNERLQSVQDGWG